MTDYQELIDAETWDFIHRSDQFYPPDTASLSIREQRAIYDRMCRQFHRGYPAQVTARDDRIAGIPCRIFPGQGPTLAYFHGGGFVVGGLESHDDICAELRHRTGFTVVCVDYRLSPEHLHPAALDDCLAVVGALRREGPVLLAGDSAGGNLAAAVSARLARQGLDLLGQVLVYPGLGGDMTRGSYLTHAQAPMLTRDDVLFYQAIRFGGPAGLPAAEDPDSAPLRATDFSGLPPTLAIGAQCDPLADDAADYARKLTAAGGTAVAVLAQGLPHGFLRARTTVGRAARCFDLIVESLLAMAAGRFGGDDDRKSVTLA